MERSLKPLSEYQSEVAQRAEAERQQMRDRIAESADRKGYTKRDRPEQRQQQAKRQEQQQKRQTKRPSKGQDRGGPSMGR